MSTSETALALSLCAKHFAEEYKYSAGKRRSNLACLVDDLYDMAEEVVLLAQKGEALEETQAKEYQELARAKAVEWCSPYEAEVVDVIFSEAVKPTWK